MILFLFISWALLANISVEAQLLSDKPERIYMDRQNMYHGFSDVFTGSANLALQAELNSNAISNSFIQKILFGGFINESIKQDVSKRLQASNRLGLDFSAGLNGTYTQGYLTFLTAISHTEHFDSRFSPDVFELLLRGNKRYAGKTADIGLSQLQYLNYQALFFGLSSQLMSSNIIISAGLSVLKGGQYQQIKIHKGRLFTEENGESLNLDMDFDMAYTTSSRAWVPAPQGLGASAYLAFTTWGDKWRMNLEAKDLGWITWKGATVLKADSTFLYTGIEIPSILDYGNYTFAGINPDTLRVQYQVKKKEASVSRLVPFTLAANYSYYLSKKVNLLIGVKYVGNANYIPKVTLRALYFPGIKWMLSPALSYGGYGKWNVEANLLKSFADRLVLTAGATIADYLVLPRSTAGIGAQVGLSIVF